MKTIFITIRDGEVSKSILRSQVFGILKEQARLVLFVSKNKLDYFKREFFSETVSIESLPSPTHPILEEMFSDLFLYSLHTESILVKIEHSYFSGGSQIARLIKKLLWFWGGFRIFRWFWRRAYRFLPDRSFEEFFNKYKPDLIFATNLISNDDARIIKAARRQGRKVVGMTKSWDNLTVKTFLNIFPDWLMVETPLMLEDALRLDYPREKLEVVGFPKFDMYANRGSIISREEFLSGLGLDPSKKIILYAGAGDQLAPYDEEILRDFLEAVKRRRLVMPVNVLVRPHPKYKYRSEIIPPSAVWVLDRPGIIVGAKESEFEFEEEDILHLMNSLAHCDMLIHTASTLGIEAAIFDKPSITIAYDGDRVLPSALSTARYYNYTHLKRVVATGGMPMAHNFEELVKLTNEYLARPQKDRAGRLKIAQENAYKVDGQSAQRVASLILRKLA